MEEHRFLEIRNFHKIMYIDDAGGLIVHFVSLEVLTGVGGCKLSGNDDDFWLYDDFSSERKRSKSPTTSL